MKTWTKSETDALLENYNLVSNDKLYIFIPNKTPLAIYKKAYKLGLRKSKEIEFINRSISKSRENASNWNGGKYITKKGYRMVLIPGHHRADKRGHVLEHIVVWENANNLKVPDGYVIHHINENKLDNRPINLKLMKFGEHTAYHNKKRKEDKQNEH